MKRELYKFSKSNSVGLSGPLNLYFCLDTSVYMDVQVMTFGKTRLEVMIESLKNVLLDIAKLASLSSVSIDIGLCRMDGVEIIKRNYKTTDYDSVVTWLDIIPEDGISADCPFDVPMAKAKTYFQSIQRSNYSRKLFFISYGRPDPLGSAADAQTENSDMINGTGLFASYPVEIHSVGIDSDELGYLNLLDNTGGSDLLNENMDENELDKFIYSKLNTTIESWYYTSADSSDVYEGNTYSPVTMGRGNIELKREIEKQKLDIEFSIGNDFAKNWLIDSNDYFLDVTIFEKEASATRQIWEGRLVAISISGKKMKLQFESIFTSLARYGLRRIYQRVCSHTLYRRGCNLDIDDFEQSGTITNIDDNTCTISTAEADHFFTHGLLSFGEDFVSIRSQVGNQFELTRIPASILNEYNTNGSVSVNVYPGCDKTKNTCISKFDNFINYGGFPYIPGKNPFKGLIL